MTPPAPPPPAPGTSLQEPNQNTNSVLPACSFTTTTSQLSNDMGITLVFTKGKKVIFAGFKLMCYMIQWPMLPTTILLWFPL